MAFILLYVDDILLITSSNALPDQFMGLLSNEFAMKDLGPISYFLGVSVTNYPKSLFLSQAKYAMEIIERAGLADCNLAATPVDTQQKLSRNSGTPVADITEYRRLVGALQYITFTRPDISYAVQQASVYAYAHPNHNIHACSKTYSSVCERHFIIWASFTCFIT
ncbi:uncharacterized mitochondrial protein AtMg00810-like [Helianthus annuus]|uniref:uncharacterized mitochondrial protein AtMg00810-like n=1 Tax=Helianthus annuus TaxID=4232 RepID=UPI000B8FD0CB|nr:uncharacterized mitochondrial protein AtMg00810-like [Helianthus annuus]